MIWSVWRHYWFKPTPYFDLAVLRIGAVGLQLYLLLRDGLGSVRYTNGLPSSLYEPLPALKVLMLPWGWGAQPSGEAVAAIYWITVLVTGPLALFGLATNVSLFFFALGTVFLHAYFLSFGDLHHAQQIMMIALVMLSLSPSGKVLSVDHLLRKAAGRAEGGASVPLLQYRGGHAGWAIQIIQWMFPLFYLSAVASKVTTGGLEWANGFTLQYYMAQDGLRYESDLALLLSEHHLLLQGAQWAVLLFQATFFLILIYPKLKWIYIPVGLMFHVGIYLTLRAPFPQWILFYGAYIPWAAVVQRLAETRVAVAEGVRGHA